MLIMRWMMLGDSIDYLSVKFNEHRMRSLQALDIDIAKRYMSEHITEGYR